MSERPKLLDLFCGAGGAAMGYHRAGFDVVGVDVRPQPRYPFTFIQADAMTFPLEGFDAIHASPPCPAYSSATRDKSRHPDLYAATRERLVAAGVPYAIENVIGAPYQSGVVLCGSMFGLAARGEWVRRHRNFETPMFLWQMPCRHQAQRPILISGNATVSEPRTYRHSRQGPVTLWRELMGIDWMTGDELTDAIPPAYTEFIGKQLLAALDGNKQSSHFASSGEGCSGDE